MSAIYGIENAIGCRPELLGLLELWRNNGSFDIRIPTSGGYRFGPIAESIQERFFRTGQSKAQTLKDTPHGRRCAIDVHPDGFKANRDFKSQPEMREKFLSWGAFVESHGFIWGGRFGGFGSDGDMPHCEIRNWRARYKFPSGEPVEPIVPPPPEHTK